MEITVSNNRIAEKSGQQITKVDFCPRTLIQNFARREKIEPKDVDIDILAKAGFASKF